MIERAIAIAITPLWLASAATFVAVSVVMLPLDYYWRRR